MEVSVSINFFKLQCLKINRRGSSVSYQLNQKEHLALKELIWKNGEINFSSTIFSVKCKD